MIWSEVKPMQGKTPASTKALLFSLVGGLALYAANSPSSQKMEMGIGGNNLEQVVSVESPVITPVDAALLCIDVSVQGIGQSLINFYTGNHFSFSSAYAQPE